MFRVLPNHHKMRDRTDISGIILRHDETQDVIGGRQIRPQINLPVIEEWIHDCEANHHDWCNQTQTPRVPKGFRVIDCTTRKIIQWEDIDSNRMYVSLSYVWGSTDGNIIPQDQALPSSVPNTIDDAILITEQLGYRYLWIDRYCIPIDDQHSKHTQIMNMDKIYNQSILTIVAAAGTDPHYGLPGVNRLMRRPQPTIQFGKRQVIYAPYCTKDILTSKWNSRGWTYQEGLLSRRRLVFTNQQVYFQCRAMHCFESINLHLNNLRMSEPEARINKSGASPVFAPRAIGRPEFLGNRIREYLQRCFTHEEDHYHAFKGVLAALEHDFPDFKNLCGIPVRALHFPFDDLNALLPGLSWNVGKSLGNPFDRRETFPSWTWLGWKIKNRVHLPTPSHNQKPLATVSVEYADGVVLHWVEHHHLIFARDKAGLIPSALHIYGPTINVNISEDAQRLSDDENNSKILVCIHYTSI